MFTKARIVSNGEVFVGNTKPPRSLYIPTTGSVVLVMAGEQGSNVNAAPTVTFNSVLGGTILPVIPAKIVTTPANTVAFF